MTKLNNLKNKNILVSGGAGFIGSHLVDRIIKEKPSKLIVVDNLFLGKLDNLTEARSNFPSLKFYKQDAGNYKAMEKIIRNEKVDVVFNPAVVPLPVSLEKPKWTVEKNIDIVTNLCELLRLKFFKTLIHFSSSEVYGSAKYVPMDENHPISPFNPYGASKAACDHIIFSYQKSFGIDAVMIRPFNNFGPRQNKGSYAGVIPVVINNILNEETVKIYGDGEQTRDFIFVKDTAEGAIKAYKSPKTRGRILNIARGKEISVNLLVRTIREIMNSKASIIYEKPRPGNVRRHLASAKLAQKLIGFKPITSLEDGLRATIDWYKQVKNE